jgi:hypothetical protein
MGEEQERPKEKENKEGTIGRNTGKGGQRKEQERAHMGGTERQTWEEQKIYRLYRLEINRGNRQGRKRGREELRKVQIGKENGAKTDKAEASKNEMEA